MQIERIVSGGQTGVDRAALDAAIRHGISHGGWCPKGRRAEDGTIPRHYLLRETASSNYPERTEKNVVDSDATLILNQGTLDGGSLFTWELARHYRKPRFLIDLDGVVDSALIRTWIVESAVRVLNVAGPRESKRPGIYLLSAAVLDRLLAASRK
jgi:predicted Rossmann-fold nucleotide-binding protein